MKISYSFRGFEHHSDRLKDYANRRLKKLEKLVNATTLVEVVFLKDKNNKTQENKTTEIKVSYEGSDFIATEQSGEFDESIDFCVDKVFKQIVKAKEKKVDSRKV